MNCLIIFGCLLSSSFSSYVQLSDDIQKYYESTSSIKNMRLVWEDHRQSIEHSLTYAMQENIGKNGLNVFTVKGMSLRLTRSYYQKQGPVEIIYQNLHLRTLPYCWLPDGILSLSSNVLKIETTLTEMIINAQYLLLRKKSDIIEDVVKQNEFKNSPFLFKQVQNTGIVTLVVNGCVLSGYVIARLKGGKVNLGHENFKLTNCMYSVEIYEKGAGQPPVIAQYSNHDSANSLGINQYLLMTLKDEFITKLQAAVYSYVNTSAIFGQNLSAYEEDQEQLFLKTSSNLTKLIRDLNKNNLDANGGAINIPDYFTTWDYWDSTISNEHQKPATIRLSKMVLTGLGTAYNSFSGGPYKLYYPMIGEQIRFSKLQVCGDVTFMPVRDIYDFSVEISDFAVNIEIKVDSGGFSDFKTEVVGYRDIQFAMPHFIPGPIQTLITGYLKIEVPKLIIKNIKPPISELKLQSNVEQPKNDCDGSKDGAQGSSEAGSGSEKSSDALRKLNRKQQRVYKYEVNNEINK